MAIIKKGGIKQPTTSENATPPSQRGDTSKVNPVLREAFEIIELAFCQGNAVYNEETLAMSAQFIGKWFKHIEFIQDVYLPDDDGNVVLHGRGAIAKAASCYDDGSGLPVPNRVPPMPPVKPPKGSKPEGWIYHVHALPGGFETAVARATKEQWDVVTMESGLSTGARQIVFVVRREPK